MINKYKLLDAKLFCGFYHRVNKKEQRFSNLIKVEKTSENPRK